MMSCNACLMMQKSRSRRAASDLGSGLSSGPSSGPSSGLSSGPSSGLSSGLSMGTVLVVTQPMLEWKPAQAFIALPTE
jgi:hypothetical protein